MNAKIKRQLYTTILIALYFTSSVSAQTNNIVSGIVTDEVNSTPLVGVNIFVRGTGKGTITDENGKFSIQAYKGDTLIFSYIGYLSREITTQSKSNLSVTMNSDAQQLDELVVVGYGTKQKRNLTGSVSSLNFNESTTSRPTLDLASTLVGLSSGLVISQTSAAPGSEGYDILVRGRGTMNDASPLVLIDGIPGALNDVNPNNVENISVLKDAASSAIYGSRAANGVILVTTKKGVAGERFKITYNGYAGVESVTNNIDFINDMSTHMELVNEAEGFEKYPVDLINTWRKESALGNPLYPNTNWYDEMLGSSVLTKHNLSLRGGFKNGSLSLSLGFLNNNGIIENSGHTRYDFRLNSNIRIKDFLEVGGNIFGAWTETQPLSVPSFFSSIRNTTPGVIPMMNGKYGGEMFEGIPPGSNPKAFVDNVTGNTERQNVGMKVYSVVNFLKDLEWESSVGVNYKNRLGWQYFRPVALHNFQTGFEYPSRPSINSLSQGNQRNYSIVLNTLLRYSTTFQSSHHVNLLLGFDQQYNRLDQFGASKNDILGDADLFILNAGANLETITGTASDDALQSYFGRINYDYNGKYLFEANARYDGSSRFAKNNRWGFFPSFSAGWRLLEESFAQPLKTIFNDIKIRGSWGILGNNRIGDYTYQTTYGSYLYPFGGQLQQSVAPADLANEKIKWESTVISNIGVDMTFLENKLSLSVEYYDKVTEDILTKIPVPLVMGNFSPPWQNIAKMQNKGLEFQIRHINQVNTDFSYQINGNLSTVNNKVLEFDEARSISGNTITLEGYPLNSYFVLDYDRILQSQSEIDYLLDEGYVFSSYVGGIPKPGDMLYRDINGDKVFNDEDRVIKNYSSLPKLTYGLSASVTYKGIDFHIVGQGIGGSSQYWGNDGFNTFNINEGFLFRKEILNRWTPENKSTEYPRLLTSGSQLNAVSSDYWLYNTSYFRIKSIQLGFTIPEVLTTQWKIDGVRIYANLENIFTFTSFEGYNPENAGISYPLMKQIIFGLNVSL